MTILEQMLEGTKSVAILGHVRPDGDCLGSALGLYNYLRLNHPDIRAAVYLEESSPKFNYLKGYDKIRHQVDDACYELCVCLDSGDIQRLGDFQHYLDQADKSLCLDHHVTNTRYGGTNVVPDEASSTCEVLFDQLDEGKLDRYTAECLYTGIIHDTGVFQYSNTTPETLQAAAFLISFGFDFSKIIEESFYQKTYLQSQIMGRALMESIRFMDGRCIVSMVDRKTMDFYNAVPGDLDGIVNQLRNIKGIDCAIFMYETGVLEYKVSMRSNEKVDVAKVASFFGGGGHVRAAGCTMKGTFHDCINNLSLHIDKQLRGEQD